MAQAAAKAGPQRSALAALRESRGGVSAGMKAWLKDQQEVRRKLRAALAGEPRTIPELAVACSLETDRALWHLMAMRRYGEVAEAGERDRYVLYSLWKG